MGLDLTGLASGFASSTTAALGSFAPLFELVIGLALALTIITALVGIFSPGHPSAEEVEGATIDSLDI